MEEMVAPDLHVFTEDGARLELSRFRTTRDTIVAEAELSWGRVPWDGLIQHASLNLLAPTTVRQWANVAAERIPDEFDWWRFMTRACHLAVTRFRSGAPLLPLSEVELGEDTGWVLRPLLEDSQPTVMAAEGGSGKSLVGLCVAASIASGRAILPNTTVVKAGPVVILDWETSEKDHANRAAGLGVLDAPVLYRREYAPLTETAPDLAREFAKAGVVAVVVDSKGAAVSDPNEAKATLDLFNAIRRLGVPALVLDHATKAAIKGEEEITPYGSVYSQNAARQVWTAPKARVEGKSLSVAWTCRKSNNSAQKGRTLRWRFELEQRQWRYTSITVSAPEPSEEGARSKLLESLSDGHGWTKDLLQAATGLSSASVYKGLERLCGDGVVERIDGTWPAMWRTVAR